MKKIMAYLGYVLAMLGRGEMMSMGYGTER